MLLGDVAELAVLLKLKNELSGPLKNIERDLAHVNTSAGTVQGGISKMGAGAGLAATRIAMAGVAAAAGLAGVGVAAVKAAGDFQAQMNVINTIAQATPDSLSTIGDGIRKLARDTGAPLEDLTASYYDLLSAGIKVADAQSSLNLAFKLSQGALSTTNEAVDFLTTAINAYGLTQSQATVVADQFAQAVADGKVKMSDIAATFANVASVAKSAGVGIDEIAAAYGYLTAQGVPAAEVTTEMNRAIIDLMKPGTALVGLQEKLGKNYAALAAQKGLVPALEEMRVDAEKLGIPFQNLFGRLEGYKFALQTTGPALAGFNAEQQRILSSTGALDKQYAARAQGFEYQLNRFKANVRDLAITAGTQILPALSPILAKLSDALAGPEVRDAVKGLGDAVAAIFTPANIDAGIAFARDVLGGIKTALPGIIEGLKLAGSITKTAVDAFFRLPGPLQAAVIGGLAVNKLSGGLIGSGLVDVIRGLAGGGARLVGGKAGGLAGVIAGIGVPHVWVDNMPATLGPGGPNIDPGKIVDDVVKGGLITRIVATLTGGSAATLAGMIGGTLLMGYLPLIWKTVVGTKTETPSTVTSGPLAGTAIPATGIGSIDQMSQGNPALAAAIRANTTAVVDSTAATRDTDKLQNSAVGATRDMDKTLRPASEALVIAARAMEGKGFHVALSQQDRNTLNRAANDGRDAIKAMNAGLAKLDPKVAIKAASDIIKNYTTGTAKDLRWIGANEDKLRALAQKFDASGDHVTAAAIRAKLEELKRIQNSQVTEQQRTKVAAQQSVAKTQAVHDKLTKLNADENSHLGAINTTVKTQKPPVVNASFNATLNSYVSVSDMARVVYRSSISGVGISTAGNRQMGRV